nr:unnamed protein product [Digitaria exilis]
MRAAASGGCGSSGQAQRRRLGLARGPRLSLRGAPLSLRRRMRCTTPWPGGGAPTADAALSLSLLLQCCGGHAQPVNPDGSSCSHVEPPSLVRQAEGNQGEEVGFEDLGLWRQGQRRRLGGTPLRRPRQGQRDGVPAIPVRPPAAVVIAVVPSPADTADPIDGFHCNPTA